jgi:hypothetical protein
MLYVRRNKIPVKMLRIELAARFICFLEYDVETFVCALSTDSYVPDGCGPSHDIEANTCSNTVAGEEVVWYIVLFRALSAGARFVIEYAVRFCTTIMSLLSLNCYFERVRNECLWLVYFLRRPFMRRHD